MAPTGRPTLYPVGYQFGDLTILRRYNVGSAQRAVLRCTCGNIVDVTMPALLHGKSDCGHTRAARRKTAAAKERVARHTKQRVGRYDLLRETWHDMIHRASSPDEICPSWHVLSNFIAEIGAHPGEEFRLERHDPSKPFSLDNMRWRRDATEE